MYGNGIGEVKQYSPTDHPELFDHSKQPDARPGWVWVDSANRWSLQPVRTPTHVSGIAGGIPPVVLIGAAGLLAFKFLRR